jgi:hypothetical protein
VTLDISSRIDENAKHDSMIALNLTMAEYVNNKVLTAALVAWVKENKVTPTPLPEIVGDAIYRIAHRLAMKPNFTAYSYKQDMIADAMLTCIRYLDNFREDGTNAFAYITQILHNALVRCIATEQRHAYIRAKLLVESNKITEDEKERSNEIIQRFEAHKQRKKDRYHDLKQIRDAKLNTDSNEHTHANGA